LPALTVRADNDEGRRLGTFPDKLPIGVHCDGYILLYWSRGTCRSTSARLSSAECSCCATAAMDAASAGPVPQDRRDPGLSGCLREQLTSPFDSTLLEHLRWYVPCGPEVAQRFRWTVRSDRARLLRAKVSDPVPGLARPWRAGARCYLVLRPSPTTSREGRADSSAMSCRIVTSLWPLVGTA
jgi:hypothetical protein